MNIKEHIEAGHYPKDDKGRALVPRRCGYRTATIAATDAPGEWIIQGWWQRNGSTSASQQSWFVDGRLGIQGRNTSPHEDDLLPPPPRKVVRWAALSHEQLDALGMYESDGPAQREVCGGKMLARIEYEVKWS